MIKELIKLRKKMSKYAIAKELGVKWATVHLWETGVYQPNEENIKKIRELLKNKGA